MAVEAISPAGSSLPLSVFIIARNEVDRIAHTINSVRDLAREVIVVDSGSTDGTQELAQSLGARVVFNPWPGYGPQKIFAEGLCTQDWLLNLDADEALDETLMASVRAAFSAGTPQVSAFTMDRRMLFPGDSRVLQHVAGECLVRLYDKRQAGFADSLVHDSVIVKTGRTAHLQGTLVHRCFRSVGHWAQKLEEYGSLQTRDWLARGRKPPAGLRIVLEPLGAFLKCYFGRRFFLLGLSGFIGASLYAHGRLLRLAKVREAYRAGGNAA